MPDAPKHPYSIASNSVLISYLEHPVQTWDAPDSANPGRTSEHERLDRMGQATDFRGVAVQPKVIGNLLIAFVHHHHRHFSIRIDKGGGEQLASAG